MEENQTINQQQSLPNATAVLVLGILSLVFCWCYGIIGLTLGIVAIILASKANKLYLDSPSSYSESSYKNMRAGRICGIIGVCLSSIYVIIFIIYIVVLGAALTGGGLFELMEGLQSME